jgi:hypothetical protein
VCQGANTAWLPTAGRLCRASPALHCILRLDTLTHANCPALPPAPSPARPCLFLFVCPPYLPPAAGIEELPEEVPLVSEPGVDNDTLLAPAVANTTVGVPAPATQRSSAAGATSSLAITVFAVVLGAVFAL